VLSCPFCGAPETDRFDLEGHRYLVFQCMFTPEVDPRLSEGELVERLRTEYASGGAAGHFRRMCDRLHLYVTQGAGGRALQADRPG
jgi:hypothetical protein